jgi:hypothetical protein
MRTVINFRFNQYTFSLSEAYQSLGASLHVEATASLIVFYRLATFRLHDGGRSRI